MSGLLLALGVALKPNLLFLIPAAGVVWLGRLQWKKIMLVALGGLVGAGFIFVTTSWAVPGARWQDWWQILPQIMSSEQPVKWGNVSLSRIVSRWSGVEASFVFAGIGGLLVAVAAFRSLWKSRRADSNQSAWTRTYLGVAAGLLLMLLVPRLVWGHYLVIALPAMLYVLRRAGSWATLAIVALGLLVFTRHSNTVFEVLRWDIVLLAIFLWLVFDLWNDTVFPCRLAWSPLLSAKKFPEGLK